MRVISSLKLFIAFVFSSSTELIDHFPGAPSGANFSQYSGYFAVGNGRFMHYVFLESDRNPKSDPLILWLTGGPGCSGLSALFTEIGPFRVDPEGQKLSWNNWSWNRIANLLFFESPPGVGYSYVTNDNLSSGDEQTANENYQALMQFFEKFPHYQRNAFYVAGESYGGVYAPTLVKKIADTKSLFKINLKGMAIGNGCVNEKDDINTLILFMFYHGMIDENLWREVITKCCDSNSYECKFHSFTEENVCGSFVLVQLERAWSMGINPYNIYANCASDDPELQVRIKYVHEYFMRTGKKIEVKRSGVTCINETGLTIYLNEMSVRQAMHIPDRLPPWNICSDSVRINYNKTHQNMNSYVIDAIKRGTHVLLYSGDIDMACNFLLGQRFASQLGFKETLSKRSYRLDDQVAGFITKYGNLTFATIRGAGHMVPTDKPKIALNLINSFLTGEELTYGDDVNEFGWLDSSGTSFSMKLSLLFLIFIDILVQNV